MPDDPKVCTLQPFQARVMPRGCLNFDDTALRRRKGAASSASYKKEYGGRPPGSRSKIKETVEPHPPIDAVNCLLSLEQYEACFPAGSYAQVGSFYLRYEARLPERAMYYADLEALGRRHEDRHPGLFIRSCYVAYPPGPVPPRYTGQTRWRWP